MYSVHDHKIGLDAAIFENDDSSSKRYQVSCTIWGDRTKPVIVIMGGISSNRWALDQPENKRTGWWREVVNQQSYLNQQAFCFLTFDYFVYPPEFINPPVITTANQASVLHQIQTELNLPQFHAVVGSSYGGMVALAFAAQYPQNLQRLICIAAGDYNSVKSQALRLIQRQIIGLGEIKNTADSTTSPSQDNSAAYTALARTLAMIGYRGEEEFEQRFQSKQPGKALHNVESYLKHHGQIFAQSFCVSRYRQLSQSIDFHQVDVSSITAKTQLIAISTDQMVPVKLIQALQQKLLQAQVAEVNLNLIDSSFGHDGFLLEAGQLNRIFQSFFYEHKHDYSEPNKRRACGH